MILWRAEVREAIGRLEAAGHETWLVGGSLRDALMGKSPKDFDLATRATPQEVSAVFAGERVVETGIRHGTVTIFLDALPLELTTYRAESAYSDGRHPDAVRFVREIQEDLSRRDFTMNAIAAHPQRGVFDPFGGVDDIRAGLIRAVGAPEGRLSEDALRIMRALRFAATLSFRLEARTDAALRAKKALLGRVSAERLYAELSKLLCGASAGDVLRSHPEVLGVVIPELLPMQICPQENPYHIYNVLFHTARALEVIPPQPLLRWSALLHDVGKPACRTRDQAGADHFYGHSKRGAEMAREILERLRAPKRMAEQVSELVRLHDRPLRPEARQLRRLLSRLEPPLFFALLQLKRADNLAQAPACYARLPQYRQIAEMAKTILAEETALHRGDLEVDGNDLMALGLQGKEIGLSLQRLLDAVLEERLCNKRGDLLRYLQEAQGIPKEKNRGENAGV